MPRAGLTPASVVEAALRVVDEQGGEALTLAAVAARTGVATPSLYKHVRNLAELRERVALRAMDEMAVVLGEAVMGRSRDEAVAELMRAWRRYAVEHPHRYAAIPPSPLHNSELEAAGRRMIGVILAVLRGYDLDGPAAIHATRCLRAAAHGFATLESSGGFRLPEDLDETFEQLIAMVVASLTPSATPPR
ncbi:TetR/AcrR family transcriptional regulator [Nonomuraea sp. NPDC046570]|uniref:TetR/AcrR family transcriptional regulator n=1 Tax=Nonomuraea sp. NPDC046570 TaxID=3155255 RepID=UPI0033CD7A71